MKQTQVLLKQLGKSIQNWTDAINQWICTIKSCEDLEQLLGCIGGLVQAVKTLAKALINLNNVIQQSVVNGDICAEKLPLINKALKALVKAENGVATQMKNAICRSGSCVSCSDLSSLTAAINRLANNKQILAKTLTPLNGPRAVELKEYSNGQSGVNAALLKIAPALEAFSKQIKGLKCNCPTAIAFANALSKLAKAELAISKSLAVC